MTALRAYHFSPRTKDHPTPFSDIYNETNAQRCVKKYNVIYTWNSLDTKIQKGKTHPASWDNNMYANASWGVGSLMATIVIIDVCK